MYGRAAQCVANSDTPVGASSSNSSCHRFTRSEAQALLFVLNIVPYNHANLQICSCMQRNFME